MGFILIALAVVFDVNGSSVGQWKEAFSYFSQIFRGTKTDVFMIYSLPVRPK